MTECGIHTDRGVLHPSQALAKMQDPEVKQEIQDLGVVRPVTSEGQGIDRGVKGRVEDNTAPIDRNLASIEMYSRQGQVRPGAPWPKTALPLHSTPRLRP
jgi:hypothetical protein